MTKNAIKVNLISRSMHPFDAHEQQELVMRTFRSSPDCYAT